MIYVDKSRVRLRFFLSPGKYDVVCSAHNDISSPIKDIGFSECRDYYVRCLPVLIPSTVTGSNNSRREC